MGTNNIEVANTAGGNDGAATPASTGQNTFSGTAGTGGKLCLPYAGGGWHGFYIMAESGDNCVVGYDHGNKSASAAILGQWNNSFAPPATKAEGKGVDNGNFQQKQWITPKNVQIILDPNTPYLLLAGPNAAPHYILMETSRIAIHGDTGINISALKKSVTFDSDGSLDIKTINGAYTSQAVSTISAALGIEAGVYSSQMVGGLTWAAGGMNITCAPKIPKGCKASWAFPSGFGVFAVNTQALIGRSFAKFPTGMSTDKLDWKGKVWEVVWTKVVTKMVDVFGQGVRDGVAAIGKGADPGGKWETIWSGIGIFLGLVTAQLYGQIIKSKTETDTRKQVTEVVRSIDDLVIKTKKFTIDAEEGITSYIKKALSIESKDMIVESSADGDGMIWFQSHKEVHIKDKKYELTMKKDIHWKAKKFTAKSGDAIYYGKVIQLKP